MCPQLHIIRLHLPVKSKLNGWMRQAFKKSSIKLGRAARVTRSTLRKTEELARMTPEVLKMLIVLKKRKGNVTFLSPSSSLGLYLPHCKPHL